MRVEIAGVELRSTVIAAGRTFGYGVEFEEIVSLNRIGAFVTKGLSLEAMAGNPTPRIVETPAGMMNSIGLQNIGVDAFIQEKLPRLRAMRGGGWCDHGWRDPWAHWRTPDIVLGRPCQPRVA